ncbi:MAG: Sensor protein [Bacteroidetes bacterium]|nr:MAG: Sensor protein [Bacteroidota bacterium]
MENDSTQQSLSNEISKTFLTTESIIQTASDLIWAIDSNYCLIFDNITFQEITKKGIGRSLNKGENVLSQDWDPGFLSFWKELYDRVLLKGERFTIEIPIVFSPDPEHVEFSFSPLNINKQMVNGVLIMGRNITSHHKLIKEKEKEERKYKAIVDQAKEMLFLHDQRGNIVEVNKEAIRNSGYTREELLKLTVYNIDPDAKDRLDSENIWNTIGPLSEVSFEVRHRRKDGSYYPAEVNASKIEVDGEFYILALVRDLTLKKKLQEELNTSSLFANNVISSMNEGFTLLDLEGKHKSVNHAFIKMTGFSENELLGKGAPHPYWPEEEIDVIKNAFSATLSGKNSFVKLIFKHKNGKRFPVVISSFSVNDDLGNIVGYAATIKDLSEVISFENALLQSETKYRYLFENLNQGVFYQKADGRVSDVNEAALKMFGLSRNQFIGKDSFDERWRIVNEKFEVLSPLQHPSMRALTSGEKVTSETVGIYIPEKDEYNWIIINAIPIFQENEQKPCEVFATMEDITARKNAEDSLSYTNHLLASFIENSPIFTYIKEVTPNRSKVLYASNNYDQMIGIKGKEMVGKTMDELFPAEFARAITEDDWQVVSKGIELKLNEVLNNRSYLTIKFPIKDQSRNLLAGYTIDITELKEAELALLESETELRELNATKDKFFSIIAHDLRSPFNSILGLSEILVDQINEKDYQDLDKIGRYIFESSKKAMDLLINLLEWSRSKTGRIEFSPEYIPIIPLIKESVDSLTESAHQKQIEIQLELNHNKLVFVDKAMISSILRNLISNAIKFTPNQGKVTIKMESKDRSTQICVCDNGIGMDKKTIDKLFKIDEASSRTGTNNEKGTGLGLILCKEFIEKHRGKIWVESETGIGSRFFFSIPTY